ncbi:MAG: hypothetical protein ABGX83_05455 [Nitrospira sp.]
MDIEVYRAAIDGSETRRYKTIKGALKFIDMYAGLDGEVYGNSIVSSDGVARMSVSGFNLSAEIRKIRGEAG